MYPDRDVIAQLLLARRLQQHNRARSSARVHVSLIDRKGHENTASVQFQPTVIEVVPSFLVFAI